MKEKRGILGGEKDNMVKSQPKKGLRIKGCLLHNSDLWKTPKKIYNYYVIKQIQNNFSYINKENLLDQFK